MKNLVLFLALVLSCITCFSQTCTISNASPYSWSNPGPNCVESPTPSNAGGATILVIPAGKTVIFNSVADTWTGTLIQVYGTLKVSADVTINAKIVVYNGGVADLGAKLSLGSTGGCPYNIDIKNGGKIDTGNASDRLYICGNYIIKGSGGGCNSCGGTNSGTCAYDGSTPYCIPATGFTGPIGFTESGYNGTILPIKLKYFSAAIKNESVHLTWTTSMQENFDKFVIERSANGIEFDSIGLVKGEGLNIYDTESTYTFDDKFPDIGINYYRLKAVDLDKKTEYFKVVVVPFTGKKMMWVDPNAVSSSIIQLKFNFYRTAINKVAILNNLGISMGDFLLNTDGKLELNTELKSGVYIVRYESQDTDLVARMIVK